MTNSLCVFVTLESLNSAPKRGRSAKNGVSFDAELVFVCNNPAIAKLCPLPSSTVVVASFVDRAGALSVVDPSIVLTFGVTVMFILSSDKTTGVNSIEVPHSLNSVVVVFSPG